MHVLVAIPGKHYLNALSPLLSALGERIVPVAMDQVPACQVSRSTIVSAFREALKGQSRPAVFSTTQTSPWAIFDALLADTTNRRALVFYEPAGLGIARKLEGGATTFDAVTIWSAEARSLIEFVRTNSRYVTLVRVDEALYSPRTLLEICADRFLFDLVDCTVKPAAYSVPATLYRLVAESSVRQMPALSALDARLASLALALEAGDSTYLGDLDPFIAKYCSLVHNQRNFSRMAAEADALRTANRLAEDAAQALRLQLAAKGKGFQTGASSHEIGAGPDGCLREHIASIESEKAHLLETLADVQAIAETHVSEAATLRARLEVDHRRLVKLEAELRRTASARLAASEAQSGAPDEAAAPARNWTRIAPSGMRNLAALLRPRLWLRTRRDANLVVRSDFFDADWYIERNADIHALGVDPAKHFVRYGGQEGRAPGPAFSSRCYLDENPDVAHAGLNPLLHYLRLGRAEDRKIRRAE